MVAFVTGLDETVRFIPMGTLGPAWCLSVRVLRKKLKPRDLSDSLRMNALVECFLRSSLVMGDRAWVVWLPVFDYRYRLVQSPWPTVW